MRWKDWWVMTATAYTCLILVFALFCQLDLAPPFNTSTLLQSFVLTATISLAQLLWDRFDLTARICRAPRRQILVDALLRCLICIAIVLGEGMAMDLVPRRWSSVWLTLPVIIPVFAAVYAIIYCNFRHTQKDADFINRKINSRK